jgi:hypothetical protein
MEKCVTGTAKRYGFVELTDGKSMIQTTRIITVSALLLWSMTASAQELVHFPSFEDNGAGRSSTVLNGYLSQPAGEGQGSHERTRL